MKELHSLLQTEQTKLTELKIAAAAQGGRVEGIRAALRLLDAEGAAVEAKAVGAPAVTPVAETLKKEHVAVSGKPRGKPGRPKLRLLSPDDHPGAPDKQHKRTLPPKDSDGKEAFMRERRIKMALKLSATPLGVAALNRVLDYGVSDQTVTNWLQHPWFVRGEDGLWRVTPQCRQEYFDSSN